MPLDEGELWERLGGVFRSVFADDEIEISPSTTAADIEEWDSVMHVTLIVAVEKEFGIQLSAFEIGNLKNAGELVETIRRRA